MAAKGLVLIKSLYYGSWLYLGERLSFSTSFKAAIKANGGLGPASLSSCQATESEAKAVRAPVEG